MYVNDLAFIAIYSLSIHLFTVESSSVTLYIANSKSRTLSHHKNNDLMCEIHAH